MTDHLDEATRSNFGVGLEVLSEVADIEEVRFSDLPHQEINYTILFAEASSAFEELVDRGLLAELTAPEDRIGPYARVAVLAKDYIKAMRLRRLMAKDADQVTSQFDALVAPTRTAVAPPLDRDFDRSAPSSGVDTMLAVGNGAGLPAISVPSGFSQEGLPTGIQFMGRAYGENGILAVARAYQSLTDWHQHHPPGLLAPAQGPRRSGAGGKSLGCR